MMESDMEWVGVDRRRRKALGRWWRHCSAGLVFTLAGAVAPVQAQGAKAATGSAPAPGSAAPVVLVVGDSLSAEYGIRRGSGWVALLQDKLNQERVAGRVVNASVSGDTTSGGRSRLPALLQQHRPRVVVIELGGNDALRGLPLDMTRNNLTEMTRAAKAAGARVLIAGMQVPPNYGRRYGEDFAALFASVAKAENVALVPFLLAGIADGPKAEAMFQGDRIHPVEAAHPIMLANVWPVLRPLLR
jgi:acyl-CoA thioesterase-1